MSIRLLQAIFLSGVYTAVDGATLTLDASLEADLVGQGKAVWVTKPPLRTGLVDHASEHDQMGAKIASVSVTYDASGRVVTHDSWTLTYDANGRASSQTNGTVTQTFVYNSNGQFTGITET